MVVGATYQHPVFHPPVARSKPRPPPPVSCDSPIVSRYCQTSPAEGPSLTVSSPGSSQVSEVSPGTSPGLQRGKLRHREVNNGPHRAVSRASAEGAFLVVLLAAHPPLPLLCWLLASRHLGPSLRGGAGRRGRGSARPLRPWSLTCSFASFLSWLCMWGLRSTLARLIQSWLLGHVQHSRSMKTGAMGTWRPLSSPGRVCRRTERRTRARGLETASEVNPAWHPESSPALFPPPFATAP